MKCNLINKVNSGKNNLYIVMLSHVCCAKLSNVIVAVRIRVYATTEGVAQTKCHTKKQSYVLYKT